MTRPETLVSTLYQHIVSTPLGNMMCLADDQFLYFLDFTDSADIQKKLQYVQKEAGATIVDGATAISALCQEQLSAYLAGNLHAFTIPLKLIGTEFQKQAWQSLQQIPYGQTRSYQEQAIALHNPLACRAVGSANRMNHIAIIIPCHRVINKAGTIGNYNGGVKRKKWLLHHEATISNVSL